MDKEIVVYPYSGILLSSRKELSIKEGKYNKLGLERKFINVMKSVCLKMNR